MSAREVVTGALAALILAACATPASAECVPDVLVGAIGRAKRVRVVQLGPFAERVQGRHDDAPGRFMGCPRLESYEVGGKAGGWLLDAFGRAGRYGCETPPSGAKFNAEGAGVIGIEFDTRSGRARVLVKLPEGSAEVGFASGVRYSVALTADAHRAWWRFLHEFAGERHSTPEAFLAAMLEAQPPDSPPPASPTSPGSYASDDVSTGTGQVPAMSDTGPMPAFGEYVYVEELPEAITKVAPAYPEVAREAGVDGTVLVQALVGRDGRVHDVRVQKSIPMLDAAAVAAVRQWVFKPARSKGNPVAVWVATPVKFSLH